MSSLGLYTEKLGEKRVTELEDADIFDLAADRLTENALQKIIDRKRHVSEMYPEISKKLSELYGYLVCEGGLNHYDATELFYRFSIHKLRETVGDQGTYNFLSTSMGQLQAMNRPRHQLVDEDNIPF